MERLKSEINIITKIFGFEVFQDYNNYISFLNYIKSISKPDLTVCQKPVSYGYNCLNCQKDPLCLICPDCFNEKKHEGHVWEINQYNQSQGFCDCGDISILKKEGFCSKHKGYFTNYEEMMNYVKTCFDENVIKKINDSLDTIFKLFIEQINIYYNSNIDKEGKVQLENDIFNMLDIFINFYTQIKENNSALFYLIIYKFTENFPFETNHKCYSYDSKTRLIKIIPYSNNIKHKCICPFFQILINLLLLRKTKYDEETFFSPFMATIHNKLIVSLSYMFTFPYLFYNDNLSDFRKISFQICTAEFIELIYEENNIHFFKEMLSTIYNESMKKNIELKQYDLLFQLIDNLKDFIEYFPNKEILHKIKLNFQIFGMIIDIICLFHEIITYTSFENGNYQVQLLDCEFNGLIILSHLSHLFDFDNKEAFDYIFNKFIDKIIQIKRNKENDNNNISKYTPFIVTFRAFSLFLNRFCFYYSTKNNVDLLTSFDYFKICFPQMENNNLYVFLYQELLKAFSFLLYVDKIETSQINLYNKNYFSDRIFILADITLMKYLLTTEQVQNQFSFQNVIECTNIFNANNYLNYLELQNLSRQNNRTEIIISEQKLNLQYNNSLLKFLYYIIRDNSSMIFLAFSYSKNFRMEFTDEVLNMLLLNDQKNFEEIMKNKILIFILSNRNSVMYNDIMNYLENMDNIENMKNNWLKNMINNIIGQICKKEIINKSLIFSVKKDYLIYCDIDYCYQKTINDLINYLNSFQSDFNLLNSYISPNISIEESLSNKLYELFFNENNIKQFLNFYNKLITNNKYPSLTDIFFFDCSKILCFYIKLKGINNIDENTRAKLNRTFNKCNVKEIKYIEFIKKVLEIEDTNSNRILNAKVNQMSLLKMKFYNKAKQNGNLIIQKYLEDEEMKVEEEIKEICQYCKKELDNNLNNFYGIICKLLSDYFIDALKRKKEDRIKSRRFLSCRHKIHINCYFQLINQANENNKKYYKCPICLKESNLLICDFVSIMNTNNKIIMKGMKLHEENLEEFFCLITNNGNSINLNNLDFSLANINKIFFENYSSKLIKKKVTLDDFTGNNLIEEIFYYIIMDFETFCIYYALTSKKTEQIYTWKNILFSLRYLCKTRIINSTDFLMNEFNVIYNDIVNYNINILNNSDISNIINKFIILLFILYDLTEENKKEIESIFNNNILIFTFLALYINNQQKNLEDFFQNKTQSQKAFDVYNIKYHLYQIFFNVSIKDEEQMDFDGVISFLKKSEKFKELIEKYNTNIIYINNKNEIFLEIPKFKIIDLPNNYNKFSVEYLGVNCFNCKEKREEYYICLFCGTKMCLHNNCFIVYKGKKYNYIIFHSKLCKEGQGFFLRNDSCIIYELKNDLIKSNNYVYLNSYGEYYQLGKSIDLKSDYILNEKALKENVQMYIDANIKGSRFFYHLPE